VAPTTVHGKVIIVASYAAPLVYDPPAVPQADPQPRRSTDAAGGP
jgi:hypothetical protein